MSRLLMSILAAFATLFAFDWLFHTQIMMEQYQLTADLWRSPADMHENFQWMLMTQFILAVIGTFIFAKGYENKGLSEGVRFGLLFGAVIGIMMFGSVAYLPIPMNMAIAWLVGGVLEGVAMGIALSLVYQKDSNEVNVEPLNLAS